MNPTDEVVAKAEPAERQSAIAVAGSDDWLCKFDERFRDALKDVQRASDQRKPAENLHSSDVELNERFDDLSCPRPLPEDVQNLLSQSSQDLDDEISQRTIIYHRLLAVEDEVKKRGARGFARYLIAICTGAAVILAWQSYGEATKQIIATNAPELGWSPEAGQLIASWVQQLGWTRSIESNAARPPVLETQKVRQLEADIAAVLQTVDQQLAAERQTVEQVSARQDQLASEITKLQAADIEILEKIPAPPPPPPDVGPTHKPTTRTLPASR
jgi:hypothetical protein